MTMHSVAPRDHQKYSALQTFLTTQSQTDGMVRLNGCFVANSTILEGRALVLQRQVVPECLGTLAAQGLHVPTIGQAVETSQDMLMVAKFV